MSSTSVVYRHGPLFLGKAVSGVLQGWKSDENAVCWDESLDFGIGERFLQEVNVIHLDQHICSLSSLTSIKYRFK